ncbi:MAG: hypothetical protein QM803_21345 [Rhodocyclaceae bacterium]
MNRKLVSASELASIFNTKLQTSDLLTDETRGCQVGEFYRLVVPDGDGCNWYLRSYTGPNVCSGVVNAIAADLRLRYNLMS